MPLRRVLLAMPLLTLLPIPCAGDNQVFEPTRESLSKYQVPEWYHDAKIGFFYHWGASSVSGDLWDHESMEFCRRHKHHTPPGQYGSHMYNTRGSDKEKDPLRVLHEKWYGPPEEFGYKDLIPLMTGAKWDPEEIVRLLDNAGVKYIVPMAIHHDGFAMWDSKVVDEFNAAKMGPKQNTTAQIIEAAHKRGIKVGVSTHAARHSWYFHKSPEFDTGDPRYEQLYGEGLGEGGLPQPRAIKKWEDTLAELVDTFHPDYIFVDGGTADTYARSKSYVMNEAFRRVVANYYNKAREWGGEPVISFKRESLWKEEAIPDYEGGDLLEAAPYKWQTHSSIAGWFYRVSEKAAPSFRLFRKVCDVVSKNGNLLLNLGLKADGSMRDDERAFLLDMEQWMNVVGEGIHATRPWLTFGELDPDEELFFKEKESRGVYDDPERVRMGHLRPYDGDIRYTRSKDARTVYAFRYSAPTMPFTLFSFGKSEAGEDVKVKSIRLAGSDEKVQWKRDDRGIEIKPTSRPVFADSLWPVMYTIEVR